MSLMCDDIGPIIVSFTSFITITFDRPFRFVNFFTKIIVVPFLVNFMQRRIKVSP